jgi:hypothetical protein
VGVDAKFFQIGGVLAVALVGNQKVEKIFVGLGDTGHRCRQCLRLH